MTKFLFTGLLPVTDLVDVLSLSDLHIYLTVPFVLSWSLMDALACECTVLASATAPVREMIENGRNGLLCEFFDVEQFANRAIDVLREPGRYRNLGREAVARIRGDYAIDVTLPRLARFFEEVAESGRPHDTVSACALETSVPPRPDGFLVSVAPVGRDPTHPIALHPLHSPLRTMTAVPLR